MSGGQPDSTPAAGVPLRLVIADDQAAVREALAVMLDLTVGLTVVATAKNGAEAVAAVAEFRPEVVLMDLQMPEMDGIEATAAICGSYPQTSVVALTTFDDEPSILAALGAGARGYLTKQAARADIVRAVRAAAAGQAVLDTNVEATLVHAILAKDDAAVPARVVDRPVPLPDGLTAREGEVLTLIASGLSNGEIAARLVVRESTIKTHINNIFAKAGLRDRAQAVHYAFTHGLEVE